MFNWEFHTTALIAGFFLVLVFGAVLIDRIFIHFKKERKLLDENVLLQTRLLDAYKQSNKLLCRLEEAEEIVRTWNAWWRELLLKKGKFSRYIDLTTKAKKGKRHGRRARKG